MVELLTGNTPEKWEEIKKHPFYEDMRAELLQHGEVYLATPVPALSYTSYCRYYQDGNRTEFEKTFFERRCRMMELAILVRLYGEKYVNALCDSIWATLEESTWSLPAHLKESIDDARERRCFLDLTSTRVGAELAECDMIAGEFLPDRIRARMKEDVRERIISPYFSNLYWWMEGSNNWGAVCSANVMFCIAYYGTPAEFYRAEPTMHQTQMNFIASYGKDGCCTEGLSYWGYGFGHFVRYADIVRNYTKNHPEVAVAHIKIQTPEREGETVCGKSFVKDGVVDYFAREDVRRASLFSANMRLKGNHAVSFSDAGSSYLFKPYLLSCLKKEYPCDIVCPSMTFAHKEPYELRNLLWTNPNGDYGAELIDGTVYYEEAQWFIRNSKKYSLAAKGGDNHECHNHNDVGVFLITTANGMPFADLGSGEYTREYFQEDCRYDLLVCSSRGHSVPIINGKYQARPYQKAEVQTDGGDRFSVSCGFVYDDPALREWKRSFSCDENGVTLQDVFAFSQEPCDVTERFVTREKPIPGNGGVRVGDVLLRYDADRLVLKVKEEAYSDHNSVEQTAYLIDFIPKTTAKEMVYTFRFDILA